MAPAMGAVEVPKDCLDILELSPTTTPTNATIVYSFRRTLGKKKLPIRFRCGSRSDNSMPHWP